MWVQNVFFLTIWWQIVSTEHVFSLQFDGRLWVKNMFFPYNFMADCEYRMCFFLTIWWQIVSTECVFSLQFDGRLWVQNVFFPYNLMADCEYRTCFFLTIWWQIVSTERVFSLQFASFNEVLANCKYPFKSVFYCFPSLTECQAAPFWASIQSLWRTLLPLSVGLKWLPPGRPGQDLGHKASELCCVVARWYCRL